MSTTDLNGYYSGGYFLIRAGNPGWEQLKSDLLPEQFISLSSCFSPKVVVSWGWKPGCPDCALDFGIPAQKLDEFIAWCQSESETEIDVWSMFHSIEAARRFTKRFLPDTTNLYLIGTGLPHELEEINWRYPGKGEAHGVEKRIEQHLQMEAGGEVLGFEVVGYTHNNFDCSWLCSNLAAEINHLFGIRPNQHGLFDHYEDAKKVYDWIEEDKKRAEPIPFDVWLLVSYPLNLEDID